MALLIFYLALALGVSTLCSLTEASILSISRSHVALMLKQNRPSGRMLDAMKKNIDRPLAAILTLNTIAHTVGAAGVGAQSLAIFGEQWVAATSAVLTLLILVVSEIIPKTLGAVYAGPLAPFTAYTVRGMILLTYPLVVVFQSLSKLLSGGKNPHRLTRDQVAMIAELGQEEGAIGEQEYHLIKNVLRLNTIRVSDIMTPRNVAFLLHQDMTAEEVLQKHQPLRFSRIPVYESSPDDLNGLVTRYDIISSYNSGNKSRKLSEMRRALYPIPEMASVKHALDELISRKAHILQAVDEYGVTAGLITFEDAIETLLEVEIVDELDSVADMRKIASALAKRRLDEHDLENYPEQPHKD